MAPTRCRPLATFTVAAALLLVACGLTACEKQVISESSYSMHQFPEYSSVPRATWREVPLEEESGPMESTGEGIDSGLSRFFKALGKLNPFK